VPHLAARFLRPLSSFVYMPGNPSRVNEYSVVVVTKDGDLDMQTMCDPPQPRWSSRGELSIASGQSYQVYQPFRDEEPVAEPWTLVPHVPRSQMTSPYGSVRVRKEGSKEPVNPRDMPGGVLLNIHPSRTYSPSSMKHFTLDKFPAPDATPRPGQFLLRPENEPSEKRGRTFQKEEQKTFSRSLSRGKLSSNERSSRRVITDDISMVIRRRVLKGYGLENVCLCFSPSAPTDSHFSQVVHNAEVARSGNVNADILYELWTWIESKMSRHLIVNLHDSFQDLEAFYPKVPREYMVLSLQTRVSLVYGTAFSQ
jgi:SEA/GATOR complex protein SEA4/MIOS